MWNDLLKKIKNNNFESAAEKEKWFLQVGNTPLRVITGIIGAAGAAIIDAWFWAVLRERNPRQ